MSNYKNKDNTDALYDDDHEGVTSTSVQALRPRVDSPDGGTPESLPELQTAEVGRASEEAAKGWVYFIETEDGQFVKIGFTSNPVRRLSQLGTRMPVRLKGCFPASKGTEAWLHRKFAADRTEGEWFRFTPELGALINLIGLEQPIALKPKRIPKPKREKLLAYEPLSPTIEEEKDPDAVKLGSRGGKARKKKLTPEQRSEIARMGGLAGGRGRGKK